MKSLRKKSFCFLVLIMCFTSATMVSADIVECSRCHQNTMVLDGEPTIESYYLCGQVKEMAFKYTCTNCVNPSQSEYELVKYEHTPHELERTVIATCEKCGEPIEVKVVTCEGDSISAEIEKLECLCVHFYKTAWFAALMVGLATLAGVVGFRVYRSKRNQGK